MNNGNSPPKKSIRIAFVYSSYGTGGSEKAMSRIFPMLPAYGIRPIVYLLRKNPDYFALLTSQRTLVFMFPVLGGQPQLLPHLLQSLNKLTQGLHLEAR